MQPTKPNGSNFTYTAPAGTESECVDLHVRRGIDDTFGPSITSTWQPDGEELDALFFRGAAVALTVYAKGQPVVSVGVEQHGTGDIFDFSKVPGLGMGQHGLAGEIAEAVKADEEGEGCDLSGGIFGPAMSALIRRIASVYLSQNDALSHDAIARARQIWMEHNPVEEGHDHVTPFDVLLYGSDNQKMTEDDAKCPILARAPSEYTYWEKRVWRRGVVDLELDKRVGAAVRACQDAGLFVEPPLGPVAGWAQDWICTDENGGWHGVRSTTFDDTKGKAEDRIPVCGWEKNGDVYPVGRIR